MFPIVISAPNPIHLFVRDETDEWNPLIQEINAGSYDPLKLHRVSFFLDVGLDYGTPMGFGFDGSLIIPRNPSLRSADDAMDCFNRVKAAMLLGGLHFSQTTSPELAFGELSELGYFRYTVPHGPASELSRALGERGAGSLLSIVLDQPKRVDRVHVESSFNRGKAVCLNLTRVNAAFLVTAFSSADKHEYRNALIFGWVATEQIIEHLWVDRFLKDKQLYRLEGRQKELRAVRNVGQKLEMLFQSGLLAEHAYTTLLHARKARNRFAHTGGAVARSSTTMVPGAKSICQAALTSATFPSVTRPKHGR
jgi:hypothetical protein